MAMNRKMQGMSSAKNGVHTVTMTNGTKRKMSCAEIVGWLSRHSIDPPEHCFNAVQSTVVPTEPTVRVAAIESAADPADMPVFAKREMNTDEPAVPKKKSVKKKKNTRREKEDSPDDIEKLLENVSVPLEREDNI